VCEALWDQPKHGKHKPWLCPKCSKAGTWCAGSWHQPDITQRYEVAAEIINARMTWKQSEAGVEAETIYKGRRVLIQIRPWLFFIPRYREDLYTLTGKEVELLRGDRMPAGADEVKMLIKALRNVKVGKVVYALQDRAFDAAQAAMGGKLWGKWRAYSFDGRRNDYGERHGVTYFKPKGWVKRRVKVDEERWAEIQSWPIVWHGTKLKHAAQIAFTGLRRRGEGGAPASHGQRGSGTKKSIYVSPALGLASHPVYAQLFEMSPGLWGQVVLQCKIRPGSWKVQGNTLGGFRHWPRDVRLDPNFETNQDLEYLCEDPDDLTVVGLMHRQLGAQADSSIYGDLVTQVRDQSGGPEYHWTTLLGDQMRSQGLTI